MILFSIYLLVLTSLYNLPQLIKVLKSKDVSSLSITTLLAIDLICISWTIYGIITPDLIILLANSISGVVTGWITICYLKWKNKK